MNAFSYDASGMNVKTLKALNVTIESLGQNKSHIGMQ
jgi:hypothetical protein